jgi:hypothetical protein
MAYRVAPPEPMNECQPLVQPIGASTGVAVLAEGLVLRSHDPQPGAEDQSTAAEPIDGGNGLRQLPRPVARHSGKEDAQLDPPRRLLSYPASRVLAFCWWIR